MQFKTAIKMVMTGAAFAAAGAATAEECKNPDVLRFSMIPAEEITQELVLHDPMVNQLESATGKEVEVFLPTSYASVFEAMLGAISSM